MKRLKFNLLTIGIYAIIVAVLFIPWHFEILKTINLSILLGFFFGFLNDIIIQLRKLNGEKFPNIED